MNVVSLCGRLGADAELKTAGKSPVCRMRLATTRRFKAADGTWKDSTQWHTVTLFGKRGEALVSKLKKGVLLTVQGYISYGSYEKDGVKRTTTDIIVDDLWFPGGKSDGDDRSAPSEDTSVQPYADTTADDTPF